MSAKVGFKCKCYYASAGAASGVWLVLKQTKETIEVGSEDEQIDGSDFDSPFKKYLQGQRDVPVSFTIKEDPASASWLALNTAKHTGKDIGFAAVDGDLTVSGTLVPIMADFKVTTFSLTRGINDINSRKVELRLSADSTYRPQENDIVDGPALERPLSAVTPLVRPTPAWAP